ncbi:peptide chain release factor 1-like, mitochondrial [Diorhabda carinulata]|uniref:peptide chain release factor 1-like, mitochondrial n=1 Tax=Diorhabda carinulata TaxID=1163345 RepID=UPI0025A3014B|nr:peptide chain release factor 1-like, mitochondrial [Diorhabda carinulata]
MFLFKSVRLLRVLRGARNNAISIKKYGIIHNNEIDLKVNGISLNNYIKKLQLEFDILNRDGINNERKNELLPIIQILNKRQLLVNNINSLEDLFKDNDTDIRKLAKEEKHNYEKMLEQLDKQLLQNLLPTDREDFYNSIVLEVQAGVGGQEAMLFAKEMFDMYCHFIDYKGWSYELAEYAETDLGGIRFASALVNGDSVFRYFKHEAGVHRVQRTPTTEKGGRIHTSTISVIALPQPSDIDININPSDLKIETKRASGAGGQHVNKTESAVRIVHLPSGISVECQVDRSQIKNRKLAMAKLRAILYQREVDMQSNKIEAAKKSQVKTRNRNEKIRTYNFNQDRITDHRLGINVHNLKVFFEGGAPLDNLINELENHHAVNNLLNIVNEET